MDDMIEDASTHCTLASFNISFFTQPILNPEQHSHQPIARLTESSLTIHTVPEINSSLSLTCITHSYQLHTTHIRVHCIAESHKWYESSTLLYAPHHEMDPSAISLWRI